MEDKTVPYLAYEATQARHERSSKRLVIALIITVALMFATNAIWLYAWMQYDYEGTATETRVDVDSRTGPANYIGDNGVINNGQSDSSKKDEN